MYVIHVHLCVGCMCLVSVSLYMWLYVSVQSVCLFDMYIFVCMCVPVYVRYVCVYSRYLNNQEIIQKFLNHPKHSVYFAIKIYPGQGVLLYLCKLFSLDEKVECFIFYVIYFLKVCLNLDFHQNKITSNQVNSMKQ